MFPIRLRNYCLLFFMVFSAAMPPLFSADQKTQEPSKKIPTQNIGGLLFDVDEGVKVERGPGGSVYMKSNKEYMQEKFLKIEQKFSDLEARIAKLEAKDAASQSPPPSAPPAADSENHRVLIT